jgi:hypothetical protein
MPPAGYPRYRCARSSNPTPQLGANACSPMSPTG